MKEGEFPPSQENNESLEPKEDLPQEEDQQWTPEEVAAIDRKLEEAAAIDRKKVAEELPIVRESLGLDPNGPEDEDDLSTEPTHPEIEVNSAPEKKLLTAQDAINAGVKPENVEAIINYTQEGPEREKALQDAIDRVGETKERPKTVEDVLEEAKKKGLLVELDEINDNDQEEDPNQLSSSRSAAFEEASPEKPEGVTARFDEAIKEGDIATAEALFAEHGKAKGEDWQDKKSRDIFGLLRRAGRFDEAKKYIDYATSGRDGRIDVWEKESGQKY